MFYTYLWLREDGTPYYVGKGKEKRAWRKAAPPKDRIVVYPAQSEADAFETEIALIWYYGRKDLGTGCLRNYTDGGEGQSGRVVPEEENKRRSVRLKGHATSQETRRKIGLANTGRTPQPHIGKRGPDNHMYGTHISDRQKEAIRNSNLGNTHSAGTRNHTTPHSEGTKTLLAAKVKALWADPVYRERMKNRKVRGKGKHNAIPI